jgi:hypothetical protein
MHTLGSEHRCRMRIAYDWNEKRKTFMKSAPCRCFAYQGELSVAGGCPHDYLKNSDECLYCGYVRSIWEKRA